MKYMKLMILAGLIAHISVYSAAPEPRKGSAGVAVAAESMDPETIEGNKLIWQSELSDSDYERLEKILATKKIDVNQRDSRNQNPLGHAIASNNLKLVKILLAAGADPFQFVGNPINALFEAIENYDKAARREISQANQISSQAIIKTLLDHNKELINTQIESRLLEGLLTPIMFAIKIELPEIVAMLLEYNPDLSITNSQGQTALEMARALTADDYEKILTDYNPAEEKKARAEDEPVASASAAAAAGE